MSRKTPLPSIDDLRAYLSYDPDTGIFIRLQVSPRGHPAGVPAGWKNGHGNPKAYCYVSFKGVRMMAHWAAYALMENRWPPEQLDHVNGNRTDNRWDNLRDATQSQNNMNRPAPSSSKSGIKGVSWCKREQKWRAHITVNKKFKSLGQYDTVEEAMAARKAAEKLYFGEFSSDR